MKIQEIWQEQGGFLKEGQLPAIVEQDRMHPCLVRTGGGRFIAPAQCVEHFIQIIIREGSDYVRDVSLHRAWK